MNSFAFLFFLLFFNLKNPGSSEAFLSKRSTHRVDALCNIENGTNSEAQLQKLLVEPNRDNDGALSISSFDQSIWFGQYSDPQLSPYNHYAHIVLFIDRLIKQGKIVDYEVKEKIIAVLKSRLPEEFFIYLYPFIEKIPVKMDGKDSEFGLDDSIVLLSLADAVFSAKGENLPHEGVGNLFDGNVNSKRLDFTNGNKKKSSVTLKFRKPNKIMACALTSANDFPSRDPQDWTL